MSVSNMPANALGESSGPVGEKGEAAAHVFERSADINEELQYVTYLYVLQVHSALTNNVLYAEYTNWEKLVMSELQRPKLLMVFELPSDLVAAALQIMKLNPRLE